MKFINRKKELSLIKELEQLSKKKLFSLAIYGMRRVGKTRLVLEYIKNKHLYFFVNKNKTPERLLKEYETELKKINLITEHETLSDFDAFFEILFERYKGIIVFDEFQNFFFVDKAIFGILQKNIDLNENKKNLLLILSGSFIGLLKKTFKNRKEPLYDRIKRELKLEPLDIAEVFELIENLKIKNIEEKVKLYSLFGGFPKYYVAIEDENLSGKKFNEIIDRFFLMENALFEDEVETILSLEFGKRYGTYYNILEAVAREENTLSKIASYLRKKETSITRHVKELVDLFEILKQEFPIIGKKGIYLINHPLINFWFRFFYKESSAYGRRDPLFVNKVKRELNSYIGRRFELFCQRLAKNKVIKVGFKPLIVGKQWGKIPKAERGKNTYEIDICATNETTKEILFGECKWDNNINARTVLNNLKQKSKYVNWHNDNRKEYYCIFAKSFKEKIKENNLYLFDLKDIESRMKN